MKNAFNDYIYYRLYKIQSNNVKKTLFLLEAADKLDRKIRYIGILSFFLFFILDKSLYNWIKIAISIMIVSLCYIIEQNQSIKKIKTISDKFEDSVNLWIKEMEESNIDISGINTIVDIDDIIKENEE